jgi:hypothetical protein
MKHYHPQNQNTDLVRMCATASYGMVEYQSLSKVAENTDPHFPGIQNVCLATIFKNFVTVCRINKDLVL